MAGAAGPNSSAPVLLLLKGHPGSGKTTLSRLLARQLKWALIDKDDVKDYLTAAPYSDAESNALSYTIAWRLIETQLSCGTSTIFDSPLARKELYEHGSQIAKEYGAAVVVVEVVVSSTTMWKQRLEARSLRNSTLSQHKPQTWDKLQLLISGYNGCDRWLADSKKGISSVTVDTSIAAPAECTALVIRYMIQNGLLPEQAVSLEDEVFLLSA